MPTKKKQIIRGPDFVIIRVVEVEVRKADHVTDSRIFGHLMDIFGTSFHPPSQEEKSAKTK